jgi:hypothetical protein
MIYIRWFKHIWPENLKHGGFEAPNLKSHVSLDRQAKFKADTNFVRQTIILRSYIHGWVQRPHVYVSQVAGIGSTDFETAINSLASVAALGKIHRFFFYLPKHW